MVDENGKEYGSTWLKRAGGLVKKGRARWLNEHTICLACPPNLTEESKMEHSNEVLKLPGTGSTDKAQSAAGTQNELTLNELLKRIDDIRGEMGYLQELAENWLGSEAIGIGNMVEEREKTYRQMLSFLERIYADRFAPASQRDRAEARNAILDKMNEAIDNMSCRSVDGVNIVDAIAPILRFYGELLDKI